MTPERSNMDALAGQFHREGFTIVENLVGQDCLTELREIYDGMLDGSIACGSTDRMLGGLTRQIVTPNLHHALFEKNEALDNAKIVAQQMTGCEDPLLIYSMLIHKPAGHNQITPWHQDMAYAAKPYASTNVPIPNDAVMQFWLALDDVDETMGCMEFLPGEHKKPLADHFVYSGADDDDGRLLAIRSVESCLDLKKAVQCPLKAGSATIHGYSTPHYTGPNQSETRGRRAYIFSFADPEKLAASIGNLT